MLYQVILYPHEIEEYKARVNNSLSEEEINSIINEIHQIAFKRAMASYGAKEITTKEAVIKALKYFQEQALKKNFPQYIALAGESDGRLAFTADKIISYYEKQDKEVIESCKAKEEEIPIPKRNINDNLRNAIKEIVREVLREEFHCEG